MHQAKNAHENNTFKKLSLMIQLKSKKMFSNNFKIFLIDRLFFVHYDKFRRFFINVDVFKKKITT